MAEYQSPEFKALEDAENKLIREFLQTIHKENNFQVAKDEIGKVVADLESLYFTECEKQDIVAVIPNYVLHKLLLFIKGSVEQYVNAENPDKEKCAGSLIEAIWVIIGKFFTDKVIPPNIYEIAAQNNVLENRIKELEDKNKELEDRIDSLLNQHEVY
jgi:hypothetical protein